jgi:hypothetical protein
MSFSTFEVLMGLAETDSEMLNVPVPDEDQISSMGAGNTVLSSRDSESVISFNDTISLDSDTLQDFGSIVSLPPGTLAALFRSHMMESDDGENTILSSAPSGAFIPPPEASQDIWAISPHPRFVPENSEALSTVCTETLSYQSMTALEDSASKTDDEENSSHSRALVRYPPSIQARASLEGHDRVTYVTIANQLMRDSAGEGNWYTRFTECDWEQFREVGKIILSTLEPYPKLLPIPPSPPQNHLSTDGTTDITSSYCASDLLPSNFLCTLCKDVIVGALALDCGCAASTVCSSCWETSSFAPRGMSDHLGFVWVEQRECPCCQASTNSNVPCHALDVAILQIVQSLPTADAKATCLKHNYYSRLEAWRSTVLATNLERSKKETTRHDELLARLIQEEEHILWGQQCSQERSLSNPTRTLLFLSQAAVALVAASMASVGLSVLASRR